MHTITREYTFAAAHRIEGHPKCGRIHGHNYRCEVLVTGPLDGSGMVIDFSLLDELIKPVFERLDHMYLYSSANINAECPYTRIALDRGDAVFVGQHSTAEIISRDIFHSVQAMLEFRTELKVIGVNLWETPKSCAIYRQAISMESEGYNTEVVTP